MGEVKMRNGGVSGLDDEAFVRLLKTDVADVLARRMRRDKAKGRGGRKFGGSGAETEKVSPAHKNVNDDNLKGEKLCQRQERQ
jgi:hypothetical protein